MTLRLKRRGSRFFSMSEGRKSQIVLLDERRLDIIIQPKLHSYELLDLVASHFKLREKQYFGLGFVDETNHFSWLQADKRVLDHEFPKKTGLLVLHFSIRFYVETIGLLRDVQTVELFYLNARQVIFKGPVECDSETVFELAAHVLQATNGDFVSEEETREELKKLPLIPTSSLREHPSITYCEDCVISQYEKVCGTSRGLAIVNYMTIIENLQTYGIHFYEVKDKKDIPWWLGISLRGIAVYDRDDRKTPRKLFTWKNLENLYYRDRKFSIEVSGPKRDQSDNQMSVCRRTFGATNVEVHAWFASSAQLTKNIWSMAVDQHQFYLDRKQSKSHLPAARSMSEIAADLCRSTTSLPGSLGSDLSRSPSSHSLPSLSNSRYDLTIEQSDSLKAEREMMKALRARKEALEEALLKKTEELKRLCFEEGELTGSLPHDTPPLALGESVPTFRRRVGTAFTLNVKDKDSTETELSAGLSQLELEVELQGKITSAAHRLSSDKTVSKYVRKQRRQSYVKAAGKLKEMEKKLGEMRRQLGKPVPREDAPQYQTSRIKEETQRFGGFSNISQGSMVSPSGVELEEDQIQRTHLSPSHSSPQLSYGPGGRQHLEGGPPGGKEIYQTSNSTTRHPPPSHRHHHHLPNQFQHTPYRLDGSQDSGFSSANNMYSNNLVSSHPTHLPPQPYQVEREHLQSPAASEPGWLSPLGSQYNQDFLLRNDMLYASNQRRDQQDGTVAGGVYSNQGTSPSPLLHYGSLDRQTKKASPTKEVYYRDVSPVRYANTDSYQYGRGQQQLNVGTLTRGGQDHDNGLLAPDAVHPSNVILEVPVQHETLTLSSSPLGCTDATNCYSPRLQEGVNSVYRGGGGGLGHHQQSPSYHHHHSTAPSQHQQIHRDDRSPSPQLQNTPSTPTPSSQSLQYPHFRHQHHQHQHNHPQMQSSYSHIRIEKAAQPDSLSISSPTDSLPRSIPIQVLGSNHNPTPPPSLSKSLSCSYSPNNSSPRQGGQPPPPTPPSPSPSSLVTMTSQQPHLEVTKPYEMSDFYRYSEKLRRQRLLDQYQRQLIGHTPEGSSKLSRSSTPQSVESDGHSSSHSGSYSQSHPSSHSHSHPQHPTLPSPTGTTNRAAMTPYGRSSSAPLSSMLPPQHPPPGSTQSHGPHPSYSQQHHHHPTSADCGGGVEGPLISSSSSSSSSYSVQTKGPGGASYQSSYRIQQIHTTTKHSMYQSLQPMTCKPVAAPPHNPDGDMG